MMHTGHSKSPRCKPRLRTTFAWYKRYLTVREAVDTPTDAGHPEVHPARWRAMVASDRKNQWTLNDFGLRADFD